MFKCDFEQYFDKVAMKSHQFQNISMRREKYMKLNQIYYIQYIPSFIKLNSTCRRYKTKGKQIIFAKINKEKRSYAKRTVYIIMHMKYTQKYAYTPLCEIFIIF